ncbi:uncharacterized protein [Dendrobates tinctorius]|uniref:uncharacterized protein n=1 Tax=Dendrobates tinctorius TaxID=92724 RepID=UPI003CC9D91F
MQCKGTSALHVVDKSWLFLPRPTDPQYPNERYLQCQATGHVYCLSTGSLYMSISQNTPLTTNIFSLNQRKDFHSLNKNTTPCTMKKYGSKKSKGQPVQGNDASTTPNNESKKSPNMKKADLTVQGDRAPINKNNNMTNADQHMQEKSASTATNTHCSKTTKDKHADQTILGHSALITPKNPSHTSSVFKNSLVPVTKKEKKRRRPKSVHVQDNLYGSSKKNSQQQLKKRNKKQNKHTVLQQCQPTILHISKCPNSALPSLSNPAIRSQSDTHHSGYNPFLNFKKQSFRFHVINLQPMSNPTRPFEINLDHLLFPQKTSPKIYIKDLSQNSNRKFETCSPFDSMDEWDECSLELPEKPSLYWDREEYALFGLLSSLTKRKKKQLIENLMLQGRSFIM